LISFLLGELPTNATAGNYGGPVSQLSFKLQTALAYGFTRSDSGELGKALDQQKIFFGEVNRRIKLKGFCPQRELVRRRSGVLKRRNPALPVGYARPGFRYGITQRTD